MEPLSISSDKLSIMEGNKPFRMRGTLDWPLHGRLMNEGELVFRDIVVDRRSVGANTIWFAGMLSWWPGLNPSNPAYWDDLRKGADIANEEGMRLGHVVFCDTRTQMPNRTDQLAHWDRIQAHHGDKNNVIFVLANQPGHQTQVLDPQDTLQFSRNLSFPQLLTARNNPMEEGNPVIPPMDFSCGCTSRDISKYAAKHGTSMWYVVNGWPGAYDQWMGTRQASILFEPCRIEAGTEYGVGAKPSNGWDDPSVWREIGRNLSFKGVVGGNIYSRHGVNADILKGVIRSCYIEYLGNIPGE